jgi:hypothetical protein
MNIPALVAWFVLACAGLVAVTACNSSGAVGERCTSFDDCNPTLECVIVDDAVCLPQPPEREQRTCSADADCTLSDGQLWPVEAECLDGACRCLSADISCRTANDDADDFGFILEEETCRCVFRAGEGDACATSHTCDVGLACVSGECRSAAGELNAACIRDNDCDEGTCQEFRENNSVGVCRGS